MTYSHLTGPPRNPPLRGRRAAGLAELLVVFGVLVAVVGVTAAVQLAGARAVATSGRAARALAVMERYADLLVLTVPYEDLAGGGFSAPDQGACDPPASTPTSCVTVDGRQLRIGWTVDASDAWETPGSVSVTGAAWGDEWGNLIVDRTVPRPPVEPGSGTAVVEVTVPGWADGATLLVFLADSSGTPVTTGAVAPVGADGRARILVDPGGGPMPCGAGAGCRIVLADSGDPWSVWGARAGADTRFEPPEVVLAPGGLTRVTVTVVRPRSLVVHPVGEHPDGWSEPPGSVAGTVCLWVEAAEGRRSWRWPACNRTNPDAVPFGEVPLSADGSTVSWPAETTQSPAATAPVGSRWVLWADRPAPDTCAPDRTGDRTHSGGGTLVDGAYECLSWSWGPPVGISVGGRWVDGSGDPRRIPVDVGDMETLVVPARWVTRQSPQRWPAWDNLRDNRACASGAPGCSPTGYADPFTLPEDTSCVGGSRCLSSWPSVAWPDGTLGTTLTGSAPQTATVTFTVRDHSSHTFTLTAPTVRANGGTMQYSNDGVLWFPLDSGTTITGSPVPTATPHTVRIRYTEPSGGLSAGRTATALLRITDPDGTRDFRVVFGRGQAVRAVRAPTSVTVPAGVRWLDWAAFATAPDGTPAPEGTPVTVEVESASGITMPGSTVTGDWRQVTATADTTGAVRVRFDLSGAQPGSWTVRASWDDGGSTVAETTTVTVSDRPVSVSVTNPSAHAWNPTVSAAGGGVVRVPVVLTLDDGSGGPAHGLELDRAGCVADGASGCATPVNVVAVDPPAGLSRVTQYRVTATWVGPWGQTLTSTGAVTAWP